ncbi:rRNA maturation RNase YbeY [Pyruvatibacter mobilis]|uniref:rRNA maturation RNase YbeY n=1 Tax=Pyruvatibacter mobilis TaxID=1712261 RepID=UPI003BB16213
MDDDSPNDVSLHIEFRCEDDSWQAVPDAETLIRQALGLAWSGGAGGAGHTGGARLAEVSVLLAGDTTLQALNREWRGKDRPTNVLSFPGPDMPVPSEDGTLVCHLGDLAMSYQTLAREADKEDKPLAHHLQHLAVHGMLHLQGHDHQTEEEAEEMEALERTLLARLGIPDPYAA